MAVRAIHEHAAGLTWVMDESMQRAAHALLVDDRVWLVDPIDDPGALERALALGRPAGVIQLLDRHERDCVAIAQRLGVPYERLPRTLPGTPFEIVPVINRRRWRERGLLWRERETLVVAEALGTAPGFAVGGAALGVHPLLRVTPPRSAFADRHPQLLLVGHGEPLGADADGSMRLALERSRSDIPRLLLELPRLLRSQR